MAAVQEPNRLYTLLPGVYKKIVIYTAAVQKPNQLYTLLLGVCIDLLFTRQPFKSQIETAALTAFNAIKQRVFIV